MKAEQIYYNPTWRDTINAANWLAFANEKRAKEVVINVGDETFNGTIDQDFTALANEKGYPKGTRIYVSKDFLAPGEFPTRPSHERIAIAIYEVI